MQNTNKSNQNTPENSGLFKRRTGIGPFSAIFVTLGIYFGSQIIAAIALAAYAIGKGYDSKLAAQLIENSILGQFLLILLIEALTLYLLWLFLGFRRTSWKDIAVTRPKKKNFLYSIPVFVVYFVVLLIATAFVQALIPSINVDQHQEIGFSGANGVGELSMVFASLVIMPAIVEEILVRGFLYGGLIKKFSKFISAIIASTVFGLAHLQIGSGEPLLWIAAIDTFILSMALIWLREKTGNIWAGAVVHMIKNSLAFISLFILKLP